MTGTQHPDISQSAFGRNWREFALISLGWVLMLGLVIQTPGTGVLACNLARTLPSANLPSEEERPAETSEIPTAKLVVSQGRRIGRSLATSPRALRMPLLNAAGCMAASHQDGSRMLMGDVRLGSGLPLRL
jgi:hypothetical protein